MKLQAIFRFVLVAYFAAAPCVTLAQQTFAQRFAAHNSAMTAVQPAFVTPLVEADPRLVQYSRASVSREYTAAGTETVSYGNGRGTGLIAGNHIEYDVIQPAYIEHHSPASTDGFGDTTASIKYRITSGNADHGNYIVTAILGHTFATGSHKNGALTDCFNPTLAGAIGVGKRVALETTLGGAMPTGKIATQGRSIAWNSLTQIHITAHSIFELENNVTFYFSGAHDGRMQNFITPGLFYIARRKEWERTHPFWILDGGMQIATSGFHTYNHNLIGEARIIF